MQKKKEEEMDRPHIKQEQPDGTVAAVEAYHLQKTQPYIISVVCVDTRADVCFPVIYCASRAEHLSEAAPAPAIQPKVYKS